MILAWMLRLALQFRMLSPPEHVRLLSHLLWSTRLFIPGGVNNAWIREGPVMLSASWFIPGSCGQLPMSRRTWSGNHWCLHWWPWLSTNCLPTVFKPFAASELGENLSFVWGSLHSANLGAKYHARAYFGFTCFTRSMQVCRLPAATFVCNVHHLRALDRPQSPLLLLVHGHGLSSSEPYRKCQVASAPHQSNPTALSKGEKC